MLERDILDRQKVPAQISASGINAVWSRHSLPSMLEIPAPANLEPGAFDRFIREAAGKLASLHGDPRASQAFSNMPVVIVAYSGGYLATSWSLKVGGVQTRVPGSYCGCALWRSGSFATWIAKNRSTFFVSAFTDPHKEECLAEIHSCPAENRYQTT